MEGPSDVQGNAVGRGTSVPVCDGEPHPFTVSVTTSAASPTSRFNS